MLPSPSLVLHTFAADWVLLSRSLLVTLITTFEGVGVERIFDEPRLVEQDREPDPTGRREQGGVIVSAHGLGIGTVIDSGSTEFLSGGTEDGGIVGSGGRIVVRSGGTAIDVTISGGGTAIVSAGGLIATDSGGTVTVDGVVINSGALLASATSSLLDIAGVVSGGGVKIGDGMVEVESGGTANVTFLSTGTGGLEIADTATNPTACTGMAKTVRELRKVTAWPEI